MKGFVFLLLLTAFASVVPYANAQGVPLTTPDDPVGDVVETTEDTLGDLQPQGSVDDVSDGVGNTARKALDAGSGSALASPGKAFRSRFDRLPSRLERLLERIELGRDVRANLRRLEQALASLSARERARLLRLLNAEIRRLRADGVSPAERKRIERLNRARTMINTQSARAGSSAAAEARTGTPRTNPASETEAPFAGGVLDATAARSEQGRSSGGAPPRDGAGDPSERSELPAFPLTEIFIALLAVLFVIVGALAFKEERWG